MALEITHQLLAFRLHRATYDVLVEYLIGIARPTTDLPWLFRHYGLVNLPDMLVLAYALRADMPKNALGALRQARQLFESTVHEMIAAYELMQQT